MFLRLEEEYWRSPFYYNSKNLNCIGALSFYNSKNLNCIGALRFF